MTTAGLRIRDLTLSYGRTVVQAGVSLPDIGTGRIVGLLGPNGVGKSTFLRAVAGLQAHRGTLDLNGESVAAMDPARRRALIGYLPQTLPQGTTLVAYEAVVSACRAVRPDLPGSEVEAMTEEIFAELGITGIAFRALTRMSGGQRQMVGLAQVLVRRPPVLLLDEPTSALDLRWQLSVLEVTRRMVERRGGLALIALHDINIALRHCDDLAVLGRDGLIAFGPPAEAMDAGVLRRAYRVEGRIERCSLGYPIAVTDGAL